MEFHNFKQITYLNHRLRKQIYSIDIVEIILILPFLTILRHPIRFLKLMKQKSNMKILKYVILLQFNFQRKQEMESFYRGVENMLILPHVYWRYRILR